MSKELTKQELVRLSWLTELRRQGDRQCIGVYDCDGQVCALGLLVEIAGTDAELNEYEVGALVGLNKHQSDWVVSANDGVGLEVGNKLQNPTRRHTFSEIADVVEGWFRKDAP